MNGPITGTAAHPDLELDGTDASLARLESWLLDQYRTAEALTQVA